MAGICSRFSPIENLWDVLGRRVRRRDPLNVGGGFYVRSGRRSLYIKSRTLFGPCTDAAPLSLTQMEGTHLERFVTF